MFNDARSYRSYFTTSQGFRVPMAPSCFVGGYDRSAQGGQGAYGDDHSPAPKERKSVMRKLATQAALGK